MNVVYMLQFLNCTNLNILNLKQNSLTRAEEKGSGRDSQESSGEYIARKCVCECGCVWVWVCVCVSVWVGASFVLLWMREKCEWIGE